MHNKNAASSNLQCTKKILKLILFKPMRTQTSDVFELSGTISIFDMYTIELLKFCVLSTRRLLPTNDLNSLYTIRETESLLTRSVFSGHYRVPRFKTAKMKHSLQYRGTKLLNYLIARNIPFQCSALTSKINGNYFKKIVIEQQLSQIIFETLH